MLRDKIAIVTGGSRGIGRAICLELARHGARLAVLYGGNKDMADSVVEDIKSLGTFAIAYKCNVTDFDECKSVVGEVVRDMGSIDIVVNNAGITKDGLLLTMKEEDFDMVLDTNLKGAFNIVKHTVPILTKKRYGRIINISSVSGIIGNPGQLNYSASKGGLIALTKSLAKELAPRNINCNVIAPGFIETDMSNALSMEVLEKVTAQIPLKKRGRVEDVGKMVAYLAGDGGDYITGQVIKIDGGLSM
ncbi:MAG: 3-oxoacyl-[acyl-carrier-protein] reductase [Filifactoraceae bacterium]